MKKKKESRLRNTKIAIIFFIFLAVIAGVSLVFKIVLVVRAGQYDDSKRFTLSISNKKNLEVISLSPSTKSITVFKLDKSSTFFSRSIDSREKKNDANPRGKPRGFEKVLDKNVPQALVGQFLEIPIDGDITANSLDLNQKVNSLFFRAVLNYKSLQTNLTIVDLLKLLFFAITVPESSVRIKNIPQGLNTVDMDKIVRLVSDELIEKDNQTIQIINGTNIGGLGNRLARLITNMGGDVIIVATSNVPRKKSIISYIDKKTYTVERLSIVLGYETIKSAEFAISDITVIIGEDKANASPF